MSLRPTTLLAAASVAFAAGLGALAVLQHRAFRTGRYDVGNLVQAVWSTAHGDLLSMTDTQGRQISRLGAHFDPLVAAFAPLWWLWPDASLLLVAQAAAVAAGAPAVFLLAQRHLGSPWAALGLALAYLLYPPTQWLVLDDFHPVAFATPLLLWGFWFLDSGRLAAFAAVAAVACLSKEQVGLVVAAMGLWYALRPGRRAAGIAIAVAGTAVTVAALAVVARFSPSGTSPFEGRYAEVGSSPAGVAGTVLTDPVTVVAAATESGDVSFLAQLLLPLLGLPLLAPVALLTAVPELALNVLSSTDTQTSIRFHYTAGAIPGLFAATVFGAAAVLRRLPSARPALPRLVVVGTLVAGALLGPLPAWRHVPLGSGVGARDHVAGGHARAAERAVALVPAGAAVSATNTLGAHLSERRRVLGFPVVRDATWVVVDTRRPSYRDQAVGGPRFAASLAALRASSRFELVRSDDGILVFRRR
jgi:uncharacterized membrane protein